MVELYSHQKKALDRLKNGSILRGNTGSGKSLTALAYYFTKVCKGKIVGEFSVMEEPKDLYIITTAQKRDRLEWEKELAHFLLSTHQDLNPNGNLVVVDSWNNIKKYVNVVGAFFIFDEQRLVGSGTWVKTFLQIAKKNKWLLLTATPGDKWIDYIPVFLAHGFYKNRTEFLRRHVVFYPFMNFPKVQRYLEVDRLTKLRDLIIVNMDYIRDVKVFEEFDYVYCDQKKINDVRDTRWNYDMDSPIANVSQYVSYVRKITNTHPSRIEKVKELAKKHGRVIIFYNFDYELELLRTMCKEEGFTKAEWNGHLHQPIPKAPEWVYLVQYFSGSEGWNCLETNTIIFYSHTYSYRTMKQAKGRVDRLNSPFNEIYYYHITSKSWLDVAIRRCLEEKKDFNESLEVQF